MEGGAEALGRCKSGANPSEYRVRTKSSMAPLTTWPSLPVSRAPEATAKAATERYCQKRLVMPKMTSHRWGFRNGGFSSHGSDPLRRHWNRRWSLATMRYGPLLESTSPSRYSAYLSWSRVETRSTTRRTSRWAAEGSAAASSRGISWLPAMSAWKDAP